VAAVRLAVRIGVVACVAAAALAGAGRLDTALAVFDFRADANHTATFLERTYPEIDILPGASEVLEDARLWMPDDARYRVVYGSPSLERRFGNVAFFLFILMWPRSQDQSGPAPPWTFCYRCTGSSLGPEWEILADSGQGLLFARRRS
jgi:hypothetical protein